MLKESLNSTKTSKKVFYLQAACHSVFHFSYQDPGSPFPIDIFVFDNLIHVSDKFDGLN